MESNQNSNSLNSRSRIEFKKEDSLESNEVEQLLKKLVSHFDYNVITYTNKYVIEIKHKTKNIRYVLEVDKSDLLVKYNGKD